MPRVVAIFLFIDITLCIAYIANSLLGKPFFTLSRLLDLNHEASLASWYSSIQLFCIFALTALFSYRRIHRDRRLFLLAALPAVFLLMSIDESVQIHEWLGTKSDALLSGGTRHGTSFQRTGIWMIVVGLPFLAVFLVLAYRIRRQISDQISNLRLMVAGMLVMLSGALGLEAISNFIAPQYVAVMIVAEEGLEMLGATIMLWAAYRMASEYLPQSDQGSLR